MSTLQSVHSQEMPSELLSQQLGRLWDPRQPITDRLDSQAKLLWMFSSLNLKLMLEFTSWPQWGQSFRWTLDRRHIFSKTMLTFFTFSYFKLIFWGSCVSRTKGSIKCAWEIKNQKISKAQNKCKESGQIAISWGSLYRHQQTPNVFQHLSSQTAAHSRPPTGLQPFSLICYCGFRPREAKLIDALRLRVDLLPSSATSNWAPRPNP